MDATIRYKEYYGDRWIKIDIKTGLSIAFRSGHGYYAEMQEWVKNGGIIEPLYTAEELLKEEQQENEFTREIFILERNKRILEADKWELQSIQKKFDITQEMVEEYKQLLRDMPENHTTVDQWENPDWPDKLIEQVLL